MKTIKEKTNQLELSKKIAKELIAKGVKDIKPLTRENIHMMTHEACGDYILTLPVLSEVEYKQWEKRGDDHKTWNMFFTLLRLDFIYQTRQGA
jgi:hypothetical protein